MLEKWNIGTSLRRDRCLLNDFGRTDNCVWLGKLTSNRSCNRLYRSWLRVKEALNGFLKVLLPYRMKRKLGDYDSMDGWMNRSVDWSKLGQIKLSCRLSDDHNSLTLKYYLHCGALTCRLHSPDDLNQQSRQAELLSYSPTRHFF